MANPIPRTQEPTPQEASPPERKPEPRDPKKPSGPPDPILEKRIEVGADESDDLTS